MSFTFYPELNFCVCQVRIHFHFPQIDTHLSWDQLLNSFNLLLLISVPLLPYLHAPVSGLSFYSIDLFSHPPYPALLRCFSLTKYSWFLLLWCCMESCHEHWISESGTIASRGNNRVRFLPACGHNIFVNWSIYNLVLYVFLFKDTLFHIYSQFSNFGFIMNSIIVHTWINFI